MTTPSEVDSGSTEAVSCCMLGALWTSPLEVEGRRNALWQKLEGIGETAFWRSASARDGLLLGCVGETAFWNSALACVRETAF